MRRWLLVFGVAAIGCLIANAYTGIEVLLAGYVLLTAATVCCLLIISFASFRDRGAELPVVTQPVTVGWTGEFMDGNQPVMVTVTEVYDDFADLRLPDGTLAFTPLIALFNATPPKPAGQRVKSSAAGDCRHTSQVVIHMTGCQHDLTATAVITGAGEPVYRCQACAARGTLASMCPPRVVGVSSGDWRVELEADRAVVRTGNVSLRFLIPPPHSSLWRIDLVCLQGRRKHEVPHYLLGTPATATEVRTPSAPAAGRPLAKVQVPPAGYGFATRILRP